METTITIGNRIAILEIEIDELKEDIKIIDSIINSKNNYGEFIVVKPYQNDTALITRRYLHNKSIESKLSTIKNLRELSEDLSTPLIIYIWKL